MKIVVLGASGKTGQLLVAAAAAQGHEVVAVVRRIGVLKAGKGLVIMQASVEIEGDLCAAFAGADAVVSCLGVRPSLRAFCFKQDFQQRSLPTIIAAINAAQVPRFVLLSSFGSGASAKQSGAFLRLFLYGGIAKKMFDDKALAEQALQHCHANWTAVYPVTLIQAPAIATAELVPLDAVRRVPGIPRLPFANVARALLKLSQETNHAGQKLLLAPPNTWQ